MESVTTPSRTTRDALDRAAPLLRVLGNADRLHLLAALAHEEFCVSQLAERLNIQQPTLSQQLAVLRNYQFVVTRREGKRVFYRLAPRLVPQLTLVLALARTA